MCGSGLKYKKCCKNKKYSYAEKQETSLLIEGTLRHQSNIINAKSKYGDILNCKIIYTKYFNNNIDVETLVCSENIDLVLGKPRYPNNFSKCKFNVKLIVTNNIYSIEVEPHCIVCGYTKSEDTFLKILKKHNNIYICDNCIGFLKIKDDKIIIKDVTII